MKKFLRENRIEVFLILIIYAFTASSAGFTLFFDEMCSIYTDWEKPIEKRSPFCELQHFFDGLGWWWFLFGSFLLGWTIIYRNHKN